MSFSDRLKELRKVCSLTQNAVASRLCITREAYSQYESGRRRPSMETICAICDVLDVSADYLFGLSPVNLSFSAMSEKEQFIIAHLKDLDEEALSLVTMLLQLFISGSST